MMLSRHDSDWHSTALRGTHVFPVLPRPVVLAPNNPSERQKNDCSATRRTQAAANRFKDRPAKGNVVLIPLLCLLAMGTGTAGLIWYENLDSDQKRRADRLAEAYAQDLYAKGVPQLQRHEAYEVHRLVRGHFG
jgi:hypothetical protein